MKLFISYFFKTFISAILVLFILDFIYTKIYVSSKPRNKISYALQEKNQNFDVVILGSSRANNHFESKQFIDMGLHTYNFGMSGASLEESALLLEILLKENTIKNLILEVDLNLQNNYHSEGTRVGFLPYMNQSKIIELYYANRISNFEILNKIPFYRYMKYDSKIGFRESFFTSINKGSENLKKAGFYGLQGKTNSMRYDLSNKHPVASYSYEHIKSLCKINNINLIAVTTPMCKNTTGINFFNEVTTLYPEIYNLEEVVNNDFYFYSCGHMNEKGAKIYTNYILNKFF